MKKKTEKNINVQMLCVSFGAFKGYMKTLMGSGLDLAK